MELSGLEIYGAAGDLEDLQGAVQWLLPVLALPNQGGVVILDNPGGSLEAGTARVMDHRTAEPFTIALEATNVRSYEDGDVVCLLGRRYISGIERLDISLSYIDFELTWQRGPAMSLWTLATIPDLRNLQHEIDDAIERAFWSAIDTKDTNARLVDPSSARLACELLVSSPTFADVEYYTLEVVCELLQHAVNPRAYSSTVAVGTTVTGLDTDALEARALERIAQLRHVRSLVVDHESQTDLHLLIGEMSELRMPMTIEPMEDTDA